MTSFPNGQWCSINNIDIGCSLTSLNQKGKVSPFSSSCLSQRFDVLSGTLAKPGTGTPKTNGWNAKNWWFGSMFLLFLKGGGIFFLMNQPFAQENGDVLAWGSQSCGRLGLVEVKDPNEHH